MLRFLVFATFTLLVVGVAVSRGGRPAAEAHASTAGPEASDRLQVFSVERGALIFAPRVVKSAEEWRRELTPPVYRVTREGGTERAFTGATWDNHAEGVYRCADCGNDLFLSTAKYESGTGWPSFWSPVDPRNVVEKTDRSFFMTRTEVLCARCGAHLGHVFDDGPRPTGMRYCMNSAAMTFVPMTVPATLGRRGA